MVQAGHLHLHKDIEMEKKFKKTTWWIAHDKSDTVHYGKAEPGDGVMTGQPYFEEFISEDAWLDRLAELGVTPKSEGEPDE
jgi:hypothetical protein